MGTWNYRVIRSVEGKGTTKFYGYYIHEVYYDEQGKATVWTEEPVGSRGDTLSELKRDLALMRQALTRPVLEERKGKLVEAKA